MLHRCAVMHKAISILMFKLECHVIDRNPDKAAAAAAEGVTNQTPWTSGFKVVK